MTTSLAEFHSPKSIKYRAQYLSWCDETQQYIKCAFPISAGNDTEADKKAVEVLKRMELEDGDFSYINLDVIRVHHQKPAICPVCEDAACETKSHDCGR